MKLQGLKRARRQRGWTQTEAANRLGLSQSYLSMLEAGKRPLSPRLARRVKRLYGLPPTVLPRTCVFLEPELSDNQTLAEDLAKLGYPGFAYLRTRRPAKNPVEVLLAALAKDDLEARLTEALPWLLLQYEDLDASWLSAQARLHNLQNRLGFVVSLARRVTESTSQYHHRAAALRQLERELERSRLAAEDTLCQPPPPEAKRCWLEKNRSAEAAYWKLWTDWRPESLRYVA